MLRRTLAVAALAALGGGAAAGVAACGEDRPGEVKFEGDTGTATTGTGAGTTATETTSGTTGTETTP